MVNLSKLKLNDSNPRFIKDDKFEKLCKSIQETPNLLSKVKLKVDFSDGGKVLGGNMRLRALTHLKYKEIHESWVEDCSDLTEEEKRKLIIIDNASFGAWDFDALANDWDVEELADWGIDIPNFEVKEIAPAEEDDFDTTPPEEPKTVLGDLYEIGVHRLLCGDSTDSDAVKRLMNGEKADMVFTDPPYGVSYQSNFRTKTEKFEILKNDNVFIIEWINNLPLFSKGFVFVWTSWKVLKQWIEFCEPIGELSNIIIWNKGGGGMGDLKGTFCSDFEVALVYNRGAEIKGKRLGSVWDIGKDSSSKYLHPTQKPVELFCNGY